jgi:hypothetical protein
LRQRGDFMLLKYYLGLLSAIRFAERVASKRVGLFFICHQNIPCQKMKSTLKKYPLVFFVYF